MKDNLTYSILFINLLLFFFIALYISSFEVWMIFLLFFLTMFTLVLPLKQLRSSNLIHVGKKTSRFMSLVVITFFIIFVVGLFIDAPDAFSQIGLAQVLLRKVLILYIILAFFIAHWVIPEIAIFQQGIMVRGMLFEWNEIDCIRVTRVGSVVIKVKYFGFLPFQYILCTDQATCDLLEDVLKQKEFRGFEPRDSIKLETNRLP